MYQKARIANKTQKTTKHRSKKILVWCFVCILLILSFYFGFGLLARIPTLQVSVTSYDNIIVADTTKITEDVETYLSERFFYPRSNRFWFSRKKLEERIEKNFPRLSNVKVSTSQKGIDIMGTEREGAYLWCGNIPNPVQVDSPCYFADSTGFVFDIAPYFSGSSYVRLYGGIESDSENPVGQQPFNAEMFSLLEKFQKTLNDFDLHIQGVYIQSSDQIQFILRSNNPIPRAPVLKHYTENDTDLVLSNIVNALKQDSVLLDINNNYGTLEYLDARFKNQIIYKFFDSHTSVEQSYEEIIEETIEDIEAEQG